jgi:hypothetical protein
LIGIVRGVNFGESIVNAKITHLDLDIFRGDFDDSEKEIIRVRKNPKFGESVATYCEIAFFRLLSKTPRHQQIHFSDYCTSPP